MEAHEEERAYLYWLHRLPGAGESIKRRLVEQTGSARAVYEMPKKCLAALLGRGGEKGFVGLGDRAGVEEEYQKLLAGGIRLVSVFDQEYPKRLRRITGHPMILYYRGTLPEDGVMSLAIIGARECSDYGRCVAAEFAKAMAAAGINIISGMARGIDGIGQQAALAAGGFSYAVLGCGADVCYPRSNAGLYRRIPERGGILSPYLPGTRPMKQLFPYRNKIVAGLSDAVLVVEARQRSGTLITVDMALEQGKDVYAVPGRVTDRLSDGCNLLIRQGAGVALTPGDLLAEMAVLKNRKWGKGNVPSGPISLKEDSGEPSGVLGLLDINPRPLEELLLRAKERHMALGISQLSLELIQLCMEGKAKQTGGSYFSRIPN